MEFLKNLFYKVVGKQVGADIGVSRAKLTAVVFVIVTGVQEISRAWGHPIIIPDYVFKILGGAGLWAVRDSIK